MKYDTSRSLLTNLLVSAGCPQDIKEFPMETRTKMPASDGVVRDLYKLNDGSTVMMQLVVSTHLLVIVHAEYVDYDRAVDAIASGTSTVEVLGLDNLSFLKNKRLPAIYKLEALEALSELCGGAFKAAQH